MAKMNPEIKAEWVAALRSGKYTQGTGYLHNVEAAQYCCLGVLCEIAKAKGVISSDTYVPAGLSFEIERYGIGEATSHEYLPPAVVEWSGLGTKDPVILSGDEDEYDGPYQREDNITELNDNHLNFAQLAAYIEEQL